jgi:tRNA(Ile)-lysidine synthase
MGSPEPRALSPILAALRAGLSGLLPHRGDSRCCVAFSGGLDSSVVLDALAVGGAAAPGLALRALHVNHRLQPMADEWAQMAQSRCAQLGVPCEVVTVTVDPHSTLGLEAAAREARRDTFARHLRDGEVLVTAHHADDQFETVLLALLRGAGPRGLAAMPPLAPFGRGWHWRPLLDVTRAQIEAYARARELVWHEDPANFALRHDRNYLRHEVVPRLRARWPRSPQTAVRSARHLGEAVRLLDDLALDDLRRTAVEECLDVVVVASLPAARRRQLLRFWLMGLGARPPAERRLAAILNDLIDAAEDRCPQIDLDDGLSLHRHRMLVYPVRGAVPQPPPGLRLPFSRDMALELPHGGGRLALRAEAAPGDGRADASSLEARFRGERSRVRAPGRSHSLPVKELMRSIGVLPWMRAYVPLVFQDDQLIAIGDAAVPGLPEVQARIAAALEFSIPWRWRALR